MNRLENSVYQEDLKNILNQELPFLELQEKNILITGATGLIGTCIVDTLMVLNNKLNLKVKITAICRNKMKAEEIFKDYIGNEYFVIEEIDINDGFVLNGVWDYIIHGAGNNHPLAFAKEPVETMKSAIMGTFSLLDHSVNQEVKSLGTNNLKRFLLLSTGEIYGKQMSVSEEGFRETDVGIVDTLSPRSCYPEGKRAAETICSSYVNEYNLDVVIARLGYVFGATMQSTSSKADIQFFQKAINGNDIVMKSNGEQYRSYIYLADAVAGIFYCLLKGEKGQAYNISNPNSKATIKSFAETLAARAHVNLVFETPDSTEKMGYSTMKKEILISDKLQELGFQCKVDLSEGIRRTIEILAN